MRADRTHRCTLKFAKAVREDGGEAEAGGKCVAFDRLDAGFAKDLFDILIK